jgi:hypothetical protein
MLAVAPRDTSWRLDLITRRRNLTREMNHVTQAWQNGVGPHTCCHRSQYLNPDFQPLRSISCRCRRDGLSSFDERFDFKQAVQSVVQACSVNVALAKVRC